LMIKKKVFFAVCMWALAMVIVQGVASATAVTGVANGTGSVLVSGVFVDFYALNGGGTACSVGPNLGTPGCFLENVPTSGDFPAAGTVATIKDLDVSAGYPFAGPVGTVGLGQVQWSNGTTFDLTMLSPGGQQDCSLLLDAQRQAPNTTCTFFNDPTHPGLFTMQNDASGNTVSITMNWMGNAWTGSNATSSYYQGAFSTQLVGQNIQSVYSTIIGGGAVASSYSVTFAATPEPMSIALVGGGLLLLGLFGKRKMA